MSPNNIQINNVSNINISKNKKNAYGVDYSKYIYVPFIIITLIIGVLFGLRYFIVSDNMP
jgi:hypothetical protein